jgi:hypothetical protein
MASMAEIRITGGCQCGAVRYALHQKPDNPHICHCRMCQKAFGSFFAPLTGVARDKFEVTRGAISFFRSSDQVDRGFCAACGTPLSFNYVGSKRIAVSIGSLDEPALVEPATQCGIEAKMPWFAHLATLPGDQTTEDDDPAMAAKIRASSHQHPDHDTAEWPPKV